jgi:hypothetical protein
VMCWEYQLSVTKYAKINSENKELSISESSLFLYLLEW